MSDKEPLLTRSKIREAKKKEKTSFRFREERAGPPKEETRENFESANQGKSRVGQKKQVRARSSWLNRAIIIVILLLLLVFYLVFNI